MRFSCSRVLVPIRCLLIGLRLREDFGGLHSFGITFPPCCGNYAEIFSRKPPRGDAATYGGAAPSRNGCHLEGKGSWEGVSAANAVSPHAHRVPTTEEGSRGWGTLGE